MSAVQYSALLVTQRPNAYVHITRAAQRRFTLHLIATVAAVPAAIGRYAPHVIFVDLGDPADQRTGALIREHTALPLIGVVDATDTRPVVPPHSVDSLLVRAAPVDQWLLQIDAVCTGATVRRRTVRCHDLTIDLIQHTVFRGDTPVDLPPISARLLHLLAQHAPHAVAPAHITNHLWNTTEETARANIVTAIKRLRERLGGAHYVQRAGHGQYRLGVTPDGSPSDESPAAPVATDTGAHADTMPLAATVPTPVTTFIGRAADRADLCHYVAQQTRLITVLGPAGIGKTRLAVQVANDVHARFGTGVSFLPLADCTTAEQVPRRLAQLLGLEVSDSSQIMDALCRHLRQRRTLLIVDNVEHLVDDVALFIAHLLQNAAPLSVLATSREPLDIYGEQRFPVAPLSLPTGFPPLRSPTLDDLMQSEAVQLFVARAQLVQHPFTCTVDSGMLIARICQHLDGVPLAIELAAAQSDQITLADMATELAQQHHLDLLTTTARDRSPRQRTIRDAIAWSYTKLTAGEQSIFRHMGSFATACTTEAVHAVWHGAATSAETHRLLQRLVQKNMALQQEIDGVTWWSMLESIRAYATEQLVQQDEQDAAYQRRLNYYQTLLEQADEGLIQANQSVWMVRLEREYPTIDAVLHAADQQQNTRALQQITGAIWKFWMARGTIREGRHWCARALHDGRTADVGQCNPDCDGDPLRILARAWHGAGALAMLDQDYPAAHHLLTQARHHYQRADNLLGMARTTMNLGLVAQERGDIEKASILLQESLVYYEKLNDRSRMIGILYNLSELDIAIEHYSEAETRLHTVIDLCQEFCYTRFEAAAYQTLGDLAVLRSDSATALVLYHRSCNLYQNIPSAGNVAHLQTRIACIHPDYTHALALLQSVATYLVETHDVRTTIYLLEALCRIQVIHGEIDTAAQLWGATQVLRAQLSIANTPFEHHMYAPLHDLFVKERGDVSTKIAQHNGAAMSYHDVIAFAHQLTSTPSPTQATMKMS